MDPFGAQPVKLIWSLPTAENSKDTSVSNHFSDALVFLYHLSKPPSGTQKCAKDRAQKTASKTISLNLMHWWIFVLGDNLKGSDAALTYSSRAAWRIICNTARKLRCPWGCYPATSTFTKSPAMFLELAGVTESWERSVATRWWGQGFSMGQYTKNSAAIIQ